MRLLDYQTRDFRGGFPFRISKFREGGAMRFEGIGLAIIWLDQSHGPDDILVQGVGGKMGRAIVVLVRFLVVLEIARFEKMPFQAIHLIAQLVDFLENVGLHIPLHHPLEGKVGNQYVALANEMLDEAAEETAGDWFALLLLGN
ncbi:hypothetical protein MASSI9I_51390 [Massilia sp. 9I]|nr:hypothetical protein MASSI9I_51390 [Massilia sp. 9I]